MFSNLHILKKKNLPSVDMAVQQFTADFFNFVIHCCETLFFFNCLFCLENLCWYKSRCSRLFKPSSLAYLALFNSIHAYCCTGILTAIQIYILLYRYTFCCTGIFTAVQVYLLLLHAGILTVVYKYTYCWTGILTAVQVYLLMYGYTYCCCRYTNCCTVILKLMYRYTYYCRGILKLLYRYAYCCTGILTAVQVYLLLYRYTFCWTGILTAVYRYTYYCIGILTTAQVHLLLYKYTYYCMYDLHVQLLL